MNVNSVLIFFLCVCGFVIKTHWHSFTMIFVAVVFVFFSSFFFQTVMECVFTKKIHIVIF